MVDFVPKFRNLFILGRRHVHPPKCPIFVGGLRPQAPHTFGLNPSSQLVHGYHWLAFLNRLLTTVEYKVDYISKTNKNWREKKLNQKICSLRTFPENLATFEPKKNWLVTHEPDSETLTSDTREPVG